MVYDLNIKHKRAFINHKQQGLNALVSCFRVAAVDRPGAYRRWFAPPFKVVEIRMAYRIAEAHFFYQLQIF